MFKIPTFFMETLYIKQYFITVTYQDNKYRILSMVINTKVS